MGASGISIIIVLQLGLAMMPLCLDISSGLISGTISGTFLSMRKADELSITRHPVSLTRGAKLLASSLPTEKKAKSTFCLRKISGVNSSTRYSVFLKTCFLPTERLLAKRISLPIGKFRSSRISRNSSPTAPVEPTSATVYFGSIKSNNYIINIYHLLERCGRLSPRPPRLLTPPS